MVIWTALQRAFVVETFLKSGDSVITTQRLFRREFNVPRHGSVPSPNTIKLWIRNLGETASVQKKPPQESVRKARTPENIEAVRKSVIHSPLRSARRHAIALGLSSRSVRRILHQELHFHPYKMMTVHQSKELDFERRRNFADQFLLLLTEENPNLLMMSDEVHFHLSGSVNKQSFAY